MKRVKIDFFIFLDGHDSDMPTFVGYCDLLRQLNFAYNHIYMSQAKYGSTVRIPNPIYERASKAAQECGVPVGSFIADALEDVLSGLEAEAPILPRCVGKRQAHQSDPVVRKSKVKSPSKAKNKAQTGELPVRHLSV